MSYVLKSNNRKTNHVSAAAKVLGVCAVVLAVFYTFFPRALPAFFITLVRPLWNIEQDMRYGDIAREELTEAYLAVSSNAAKNNVLYAENEELKRMLGRTIAGKPLLAVVLKKPPTSAYDTFVLDVGADYGVEKGDKIYALGDIPIGEVDEVFGYTSKAKLFSSSGEKFSVLIGPEHIEASAVGKGGGHFEVSLPRDTKIEKGDQVLMPSLGDSFVGTVEGVVSEASEPFSRILFRQPINIYEQRFVIIDTNGTH